MISLILCEGKSDAVFLSYYLEKTAQWKIMKKGPKEFAINIDEGKGESAYWYRRGDEVLLICSVGGKTKFKCFFDDKIIEAIKQTSFFTKVAIVRDSDDDTSLEIAQSMNDLLAPLCNNIVLDQWSKHSYTNGYGEQKSIDILIQVVPKDQQGALVLTSHILPTQLRLSI